MNYCVRGVAFGLRDALWPPRSAARTTARHDLIAGTIFGAFLGANRSPRRVFN